MRVEAIVFSPFLVSWLGLAQTRCDRGKPAGDAPAASVAAESPGAFASAVVVPSSARSASQVVAVAGADAGSDCQPLAQSPRTERKKGPSDGKYKATTEWVSVASPDPAVDQGINGAVAADLKARRARFVKDADEALAEAKGDPDGVKPEQLAQEIKCSESVTTPSLVSIGCASSTYLGGAHPEEQRFAYSYWICAGKSPKPVTLVELCRPGTPCVKTVVGAINRRLSLGPAKDANIQVSEQSSALKHFAVTKGGLRFFVNDELPQVLQAAGTVDVPFGDLKSVLREDGPLAELLR